MAEQFDVAVIGTGTAGTTTAYDMNAEGKSVAIKQGLTGDDLKGMIYSYPTSSSDINYMV